MCNVFYWVKWGLKGEFELIQDMDLLKVRQSWKQIMLSSKEQKITILSIYWREDAQDSDFMFVFGRIEDTMNGFWEFLTFSMYCNAV